MLIIADRNIPQVAEAFGAFGEVRLRDGRALTAADVRDAEILLVRSVTPVNAALLAGSRVKFVGSATIGTDHIDRNYLHSRGIEFAYAPGSNARAVAEYVLSAIMALYENRPTGPIGIIGYGNTGSALARWLEVLGIEYLVNDPPLQNSGASKNIKFVSLAEIRRAAIISLHVPLIKNGSYPTFHLINEAFLRDLSPQCLLINTSRGAVVDNAALSAHLHNGSMRAVLDVWEGEPAIDRELLTRVSLGTPHIAGYSAEGRLNGTQQLYQALCSFLHTTPAWRYTLPALPNRILTGDLQGYAALRALVLQAYNIGCDDERLRALIAQSPAQRAAGFDRLRRDYPVRREFAAYHCAVGAGVDKTLQRQLTGLGFALDIED